METKPTAYLNQNFLRTIASYEACCDTHDDGRHFDGYDCSTCPVLAECRAAWDDQIERTGDRAVTETKAERIDRSRRTLKKQLQLC